ncbi:MAG TPA: GNAT family N-acetyltransferase [Longimicrobium sp.]|nr:GNAT family N-acetyltransferase [Longimicrobium sp.]
MSTLLEAPARASVTALSSCGEMEALRPEWEALWDRSPRATPFQHPAWLLAWWRRLGGGEPRVLALRDGRGVLRGVWPAYVWTGDGARQLTPLGNGVSDHVDLVAERGMEDGLAAAVLAHLARSDDWDTADFRDLPADSALLRAPRRGLSATVSEDEPCPVLPLPAAVPGEAAGERGEPVSIPPALLKQLRYDRRRLHRDFASTYETARDAASLDALFAALLRLHAARWGARGEPGVLRDPRAAAFHREAAAALLARGMLRLHGLRLNGALAAVWYGFAAHGRVHYYLSGFDPAYGRYGPGRVMVGHALAAAAREGAAEFDFLRGREAYKLAWGAVERPQRRLRLSRPGGPPP